MQSVDGSPKAPAPVDFSPAPNLSLLEAYARMLVLRLVEEAISDLRERGDVSGSVHLGCGQEAIPVGMLSQRAEPDAIFSTYRGHGWALACGTPPEAVIGELAGRAIGASGGRGGSPHFSAPEHGFYGENAIIGAHVPMAVGAALASRHDGSERVALAVFGEGAINQGAVYEAFNLAGAWKLPVVFVIENNLYSELTPIESVVSDEPLYKRGEPFGIPGERVDGNDPLAVAKVARTAFDGARSGDGPCLIEAMTYRIVGHYIGDAETYRTEEEVEQAKRDEPLVRARAQLDASEVAAVDERVGAAVEAAVEQALAGEHASVDHVFDHLYA